MNPIEIAKKAGLSTLRSEVTKTAVTLVVGAVAGTFAGKGYSKLVDAKTDVVGEN